MQNIQPYKQNNANPQKNAHIKAIIVLGQLILIMQNAVLKIVRAKLKFPENKVPFISTIFPQPYPPIKDPTPITIVIDPAKILFFSSLGNNQIIYDEQYPRQMPSITNMRKTIYILGKNFTTPINLFFKVYGAYSYFFINSYQCQINDTPLLSLEILIFYGLVIKKTQNIVDIMPIVTIIQKQVQLSKNPRPKVDMIPAVIFDKVYIDINIPYNYPLIWARLYFQHIM